MFTLKAVNAKTCLIIFLPAPSREIGNMIAYFRKQIQVSTEMFYFCFLVMSDFSKMMLSRCVLTSAIISVKLALWG